MGEEASCGCFSTSADIGGRPACRASTRRRQGQQSVKGDAGESSAPLHDLFGEDLQKK